MPLGGLQHYTIEPADLEKTKDFYCDVLGLENGDRPPLDFPGYWLYSGGTPPDNRRGPPNRPRAPWVPAPERKKKNPARLNHMPFPPPASQGMRKRLKARNANSVNTTVPG